MTEKEVTYRPRDIVLLRIYISILMQYKKMHLTASFRRVWLYLKLETKSVRNVYMIELSTLKRSPKWSVHINPPQGTPGNKPRANIIS